MGQRCILYYKHGWDTYLTRSADLCKHTSGCSANKSRLYCPLTSAELLIVNVTQLQRRASTVDWGSLSMTSWLTAANTPHLLQDTTHTHIHTDTTRHPRLSQVCVCVGSSCLRQVAVQEVGRVYQICQQLAGKRVFSQEESKYGWGAVQVESHQVFI